MGYEIKLIIGRLGVERENADLRYFIKQTSIDLSKCSYESEIYKLSTDVKKIKFKTFPVFWSDTFKIDQKNVVKKIFGMNKYSIGKKDDIASLLGGEEEDIKKNVQKLSKIFESWESEVIEDNYGDKLFAIPLPVVLKALKKDNAKALLDEGETYAPFDIAIALIESSLKAYPFRKVKKGEHDYNLYCVLWGY